MKPPANLDAPPLGWQSWPTEAQIAEHEQGKGAWLARRPTIDVYDRRGLSPMLLGAFDEEGCFVHGSSGAVSAGRVYAGDCVFCPVDEWGRTVLLRTATPTAGGKEL